MYKRQPRESFYLATKLPLWSCKTLDEAKDIFEKQFERLGVDYICLLYTSRCV